MEKTDDGFYEYVINMTQDTGIIQWLRNMKEDFDSRLRCPTCRKRNVNITISQKAVMWCEDCKKWTDYIILDKISPKDYNSVTLLHEDKIIDILKAKGIRIE